MPHYLQDRRSPTWSRRRARRIISIMRTCVIPITKHVGKRRGGKLGKVFPLPASASQNRHAQGRADAGSFPTCKDHYIDRDSRYFQHNEKLRWRYLKLVTCHLLCRAGAWGNKPGRISNTQETSGSLRLKLKGTKTALALKLNMTASVWRSVFPAGRLLLAKFTLQYDAIEKEYRSVACVYKN